MCRRLVEMSETQSRAVVSGLASCTTAIASTARHDMDMETFERIHGVQRRKMPTVHSGDEAAQSTCKQMLKQP